MALSAHHISPLTAQLMSQRCTNRIKKTDGSAKNPIMPVPNSFTNLQTSIVQILETLIFHIKSSMNGHLILPSITSGGDKKQPWKHTLEDSQVGFVIVSNFLNMDIVFAFNKLLSSGI